MRRLISLSLTFAVGFAAMLLFATNRASAQCYSGNYLSYSGYYSGSWYYPQRYVYDMPAPASPAPVSQQAAPSSTQPKAQTPQPTMQAAQPGPLEYRSYSAQPAPATTFTYPIQSYPTYGGYNGYGTYGWPGYYGGSGYGYGNTTGSSYDDERHHGIP
jgi:hypothetical protein